MPGTIKVKIIAARDLPVMDRASETADAFVEIKFGSATVKTEICPKTLHPVWNSDWFKFEAEDEELQDDCVQIRVMDYDTYSANDAIGRVYVDLNPLLSADSPCQLLGWLPIYDTMHGIRGEIHLMVRVELFTDTLRQGKEASCGIRIFSTAGPPYGFEAVAIHGFVEELIASNDPEYHWIDKIRTPRASNEARQVLFSKMSGEVMRKVGIKTQEKGGNAILGYRQCFDLEGATGVVVRATGTAVTLIRSVPKRSSDSPIVTDHSDHFVTPQLSLPTGVLHATADPNSLRKTVLRSSDGDQLIPLFNLPRVVDADIVDPTMMGQELNGNAQTAPAVATSCYVNGSTPILLMENPLFTLSEIPENTSIQFASVVSARSVKVLDEIDEEDESRDEWWQELRSEMRHHMKSVHANCVIGYREQMAIYEDVCVLSAVGTAVALDLRSFNKFGNPDKLDFVEAAINSDDIDLPLDMTLAKDLLKDSLPNNKKCNVWHLPYSDLQSHISSSGNKLQSCAICGSGFVPEVMLSTTDPPADFEFDAEPRLIQARNVRQKSLNSKAEVLAKEISDMLPFIEHDLHSQLLAKMASLECNALFGLRFEIVFGESWVVALATGSGTTVSALGIPYGVTASAPNTGHPENRSASLVPDRRISLLKNTPTSTSLVNPSISMDRSVTIVELAEYTVNATEAFDQHFHCWTLSSLPKCLADKYSQLHMFCRISRQTFDSEYGLSTRDLSFSIDEMLKKILYKYRKLRPVCLSNLYFAITLPEDDELQIAVSGMILISKSLILPNPTSLILTGRSKRISGSSKKSDDGSSSDNRSLSRSTSQPPIQIFSNGRKIRHSTPQASSFLDTIVERLAQSVFLTILPEPPKGTIETYLGHYDFFFIRETNSLKEAGGLGLFLQAVLSEVLFVVQAHVAALGGDGLVSFRWSLSDMLHNLNRNHAQCLFYVVGDIVATNN